jgi:hypothetical protein
MNTQVTEGIGFFLPPADPDLRATDGLVRRDAGRNRFEFLAG